MKEENCGLHQQVSQLQSQLATVEQESQQQLSKLEDENRDLHKEIVKYKSEQQQEELKILQQKGKTHY